MIRRLLIANRGEIAVRVARGARELGIVPVGVYSEADAGAFHLTVMDAAQCIGPAAAAESYLNIGAILEAAKALHADAVHPGYGFLSERADFAQAVLDAGLIFVGPSPQSMAAMGSKIEAKRRVRAAGVPVVPGYDGGDPDAQTLRREAAHIGVPLLIKASAGGGGRGMRVVDDLAHFDDALAGARRESQAAFGDDTVLFEKYVRRPRHIEFQILADAHGRTIHLGERECSIQRRHQKIVEEAPSVALSEELRVEMGAAAVAAARAVEYVNAGTCEFILDEDASYYFLEMNTRLQVEHPVTELVYGVDLVHWQLRVASGEPLTLLQDAARPRGWAIETRIYAEDPANHMLPSIGTLTQWQVPQGPGIRVDAGVTQGSEVSLHYDPMLAKLIVFGESRGVAIARLQAALDAFRIRGIRSNVPLLQWIALDEAFAAGDTTTQFLAERLDEAIFAPAEISADAALCGAAELVREGRVPWRIAGVGAPLRLRAGASDFAFEASLDRGGRWEIAGEGQRRALADIARDGMVPEVTLAPAPSIEGLGHATHGGSEGRIAAPMPGKLLKIAVREGDTVAEHDLLAVLEAMKMEHRIEAPSDGTVKTVAVREGDVVAGGAHLMEIA